MEGSALENLNTFKKLCGPEFYPNVILATTFWTEINQDEGVARERNLQKFWGHMLQKGSTMVRLPDSEEESIDLLVHLSQKSEMTMQFQKDSSAAFKELETKFEEQNARHLRNRDEAQLYFDGKLRDIFENHQQDEQKIEEQKKAGREALKEIKRANERIRKEQRDMEEQLRQLYLQCESPTASSGPSHPVRMGVGHRIAKEDNFFSQLHQLELARIDGTVSVNFTSNLLSIPIRSCSRCGSLTSAKLSYCKTTISLVCAGERGLKLSRLGCSKCLIDICQPCYLSGMRCSRTSHEPLARRSLTGTAAGKCKRATQDLKPSQILCNWCKKPLDGLFLRKP